MHNKYTFAQLEKDGVEATGTIDGEPFLGWIMNTTDFVHYARDAQQISPVTEAANLTPVEWSRHATEKSDLHAVIRFRRAIQFPRFAMRKGERWGFVVFQKKVDHIKAIEAGERFDFAGGQCLADDVEILYIGPGNLDYSRASGYI